MPVPKVSVLERVDCIIIIIIIIIIVVVVVVVIITTMRMVELFYANSHGTVYFTT